MVFSSPGPSVWPRLQSDSQGYYLTSSDMLHMKGRTFSCSLACLLISLINLTEYLQMAVVMVMHTN